MKIYYQLATSALALPAFALSLLMYTPTPSDSHPLLWPLLSHPPQSTAGLNCRRVLAVIFEEHKIFVLFMCVCMILINLIAFCVTLCMGQKGYLFSPKSMYAGVGEKEAKGEGSRGRVREEGGETARAEHQADTSCQPIRDALGSCRDPGWEPGAGGARSRAWALPRTASSSAQSSEKVPHLLLIN